MTAVTIQTPSTASALDARPKRGKGVPFKAAFRSTTAKSGTRRSSRIHTDAGIPPGCGLFRILSS